MNDEDSGVLSLNKGSMELFSAVNAEMRLFRSLDLSDLSEVISLLRNNQAKPPSLLIPVKIAGGKRRKGRYARP